jgi:menaquinone-dependent protoporphyrinogen oxidase
VIEDALAARPLWLFSVGPLGDPPKPQDPEPQELAAVVTATGAREHRVFTGRLDR